MVHGYIGNLPLTFLIDTGSSLTLIITHVFQQLDPRLKSTRKKPPSSLSLRLADQSHLYVQWQLNLPFTLYNQTRWHTVYVVPNLWRPCIIGNNFIRTHRLYIDGAKQRVYFHNNSPYKKQFRYPKTSLNYPPLNSTPAL